MLHDAAPRQLGRYRLIRRIGRGGMGEVFVALVDGPAGFSRSVVVKRLVPELAADERFIAMLQAEARISARLHHPNIVQVHEFGEADGELFLAMELVKGRDLRELLAACRRRGQRLPVALACYIVAEIADALAYAHALTDEAGRPLELVHRDVSPSNIMIEEQGALKLLDFGVARAADSQRTRSGVLKGKIPYVSPEQAEGARVDRRSDIFSLGVVLYECLTLERPFDGDDELATLARIREARWRPLSSLRPDIDADVEALVQRMLARLPEARFADCGELVAALGPIVHRLGGDAPSLRRFVGEGASDAGRADDAGRARGARRERAGDTRARPTEPFRQARRRRSATAAVVVVAVVVALAGMGGWLVHARRDGRPRATATPPASAAPTTMPPSSEPAATRPSAAPATMPPSAATAAMPPPARRVTLVVRGPSHATLVVDGSVAGTLPRTLVLPARSGTRQLLVRSAGRPVWSRRVPADADATVEARWPASRRSGPAHTTHDRAWTPESVSPW